MIRRALILLVVASALGLIFATWMAPRPADGQEAPRELKQPPAQPSTEARALNRPFVEATRKVRPAVVRILNIQQTWRGQLQPASSGSGFIVSPEGHILTNRHVVNGAVRLQVSLPDGRVFSEVKLLGEDVRSDVAVIQILGAKDLPVAVMGDSDPLDVGDWVIAIGAPFELESSVSAGVVSATGRTGVMGRGEGEDVTEEFIQTDAALNPGNSGGPLVNLDGQVVGINTAISTGGFSQVNAGVGFAIPINLARTVAVSLIERGFARRGWLGLSSVAVGREILERLGVEGRGALKVSSVEKDSPAARAGIEPEDLLLSVDGRPAADGEALRARLAAAGPGSTVEISLLRGGKERKVRVQLGEEPLYTFGLEVQDVSDRVAAQVGLPAGTPGVVITEVAPGSPARADPQNQMLFPGDVVVRIDWGSNRMPITSRKDFLEAMQKIPARAGTVRFWLRVRDGYYPVYLRRAAN